MGRQYLRQSYGHQHRYRGKENSDATEPLRLSLPQGERSTTQTGDCKAQHCHQVIRVVWVEQYGSAETGALTVAGDRPLRSDHQHWNREGQPRGQGRVHRLTDDGERRHVTNDLVVLVE